MGSVAMQECTQPELISETGCYKTVLVVEDERLVRVATCELLRESGFDVLAAENAAAARRLFSKSAKDIDLLFCDHILPDGNGIDLSRELQARAPCLKIVLTSGYPHAVLRDVENETEEVFLAKPFSAESLIAKLHSALWSETAGARVELLSRTITDSLKNLPG